MLTALLESSGSLDNIYLISISRAAGNLVCGPWLESHLRLVPDVLHVRFISFET